MTTGQNFSLEFTEIMVPDDKTGQYSAFFAEFPEAIACGDSIEEAQSNLYNLFRVMLEDKKKTQYQHLDHVKYITRPR
jgi:predicted RNase H-like HicB family nuclease